MPLRVDINFTLNGTPKYASVPPDLSALNLIRDICGLTGTKYGCGEGECGACTIIVGGRSLCACLMFAVDCDGREVLTVEGVAHDQTARKLVDAFTDAGAVQCGFCTPGFVVQSKYLVDSEPSADRERIKRGLEGNICRCTGYRKIIDAVASVTCSSDSGVEEEGGPA